MKCDQIKMIKPFKLYVYFPLPLKNYARATPGTFSVRFTYTKYTIPHLAVLFSASGVGDVCKGDWDGDGVPDAYDASRHNSKITFTDFRRLHNVNLDPHEISQADAAWVVKNKVSCPRHP